MTMPDACSHKVGRCTERREQRFVQILQNPSEVPSLGIFAAVLSVLVLAFAMYASILLRQAAVLFLEKL